MLILTRRIGESIVIGKNVKVTVLSIKGNQVRLGIDAPRTISVHREEIYQRIRAVNLIAESTEYHMKGGDTTFLVSVTLREF